MGDVAVTLREGAAGSTPSCSTWTTALRHSPQSGNAGLYDNAGLAAREARAQAGGVLAVWSAWDDRKFEQRLRYGRFRVEGARVRGRLKKGGPRHVIFLGETGSPSPRVTTAPRGRRRSEGAR